MKYNMENIKWKIDVVSIINYLNKLKYEIRLTPILELKRFKNGNSLTKMVSITFRNDKEYFSTESWHSREYVKSSDLFDTKEQAQKEGLRKLIDILNKESEIPNISKVELSKEQIKKIMIHLYVCTGCENSSNLLPICDKCGNDIEENEAEHYSPTNDFVNKINKLINE